MLKYALLLVIITSVMGLFAGGKKDAKQTAPTKFYDFSATSITGEKIQMDSYKGKVVVVVNVASKCGFTPQYEGLEKLYQKYGKDGLVILGFPCNQFAGQEPGSEEAIQEFCSLTYGVTFPMFSKIDVNGKDADPLYVFLKSQQSGFPGEMIKWNFTKFVINREGKVVERYGSATTPESMEERLLELINN